MSKRYFGGRWPGGRYSRRGWLAAGFPAVIVGVDGPTASGAKLEGLNNPGPELPINEISRIGLDTSKAVFTLHALDRAGQPVLRLNPRRAQMVPFLRKRPPTVVAMEVCGGSHHWARKLTALGHEVRLIPPQGCCPEGLPP